MSTPLVSVIVPSYNYADSLAVCLQAIADQSYPAIEVLVVDDRSTDDSVAVAEAQGVRVIALADNGGCGRARNIGVASTSGEILFFVDADVAMAPDAVAEAVAILQAEPEVGAVCGIEDPEPLLHDTAVARYRGLQYHHWSASGEGNVTFLFPAMCAIRRRVYQEVGPFNPALKQTEEVDYGYRLSRRHQLRLTSRVRGRHDHDHQLVPLLRKLFHRARLRIPLYARARRFATGFETASRAWGSLAAAAAVPAVALPALLGPLWSVVPLGLFIASVAADRPMYALAHRLRGVPFLIFFVAVHFVVNVTITAGVAVGTLQWLVSRPFRQLYDSTFPAEATV
ncbi:MULTISPECIES: glycosyltransferase family 2 protein [unclassified Solwaraspora]|uniref:glycosyltransferase family 2 protein n=1 Tax=unclassified Solwaraspora TaxID=2627926 RepID=UPI00248B4C95|nr:MULTISPECIES: glycosyltransferase family 2 protein [unclassified Solwaraspora]WBB99363.1 glycosyltransferase family 2 protein [Solwaraspora sp. WMMA2059]WBC22087.1 glycosyltransferase family 2 protein [Solwaraspora sp. WMMA2080]WJK35869.1 glycosyltransferase family 2 protein [Solwaraspora sp. WMMA2065]